MRARGKDEEEQDEKLLLSEAYSRRGSLAQVKWTRLFIIMIHSLAKKKEKKNIKCHKVQRGTERHTAVGE